MNVKDSLIYCFCLLKHKDRKTINPLDTDQWEFYIVTTEFLNFHFGDQKKISLSKLLKNNVKSVKYQEIKLFIDNIKQKI